MPGHDGILPFFADTILMGSHFDRFFDRGRRCFGRKNIPAISVGTTALAITVATRNEYCPCVTIPCDNPYSAEIVPKVNPVDMSNV